jgi:hypothetical protein
MTTITVENITGKARDAGSAINTAMPQPVTSAAQKAYDKVAGGAQWYFEQWEDLIEEARAERMAGREQIDLDDLLASLAEAKVITDFPGRLRVRPSQLKGQSHLAQQCVERLDQLDGIDEIHASPLTGSVLLIYDRQQYKSRDELLAAVAKA